MSSLFYWLSGRCGFQKCKDICVLTTDVKGSRPLTNYNYIISYSNYNLKLTGGWAAVKALKRAKIFQKSDERILGDGNFVESVLVSANEAMERKYDLQSRGFTLDKAAARVAEVSGMKPQDVWTAGRYRHIVEARSLLCYWAVREMGIPMSSLARKLKISVSAVSKSAIRGEKLAKDRKYTLIG